MYKSINDVVGYKPGPTQEELFEQTFAQHRDKDFKMPTKLMEIIKK